MSVYFFGQPEEARRIEGNFFLLKSKTQFPEDNEHPHTKCWKLQIKELELGLPGGTVVKSLPANSGSVSSIPGLRIFYMLPSN